MLENKVKQKKTSEYIPEIYKTSLEQISRQVKKINLPYSCGSKCNPVGGAKRRTSNTERNNPSKIFENSCAESGGNST